MESRHPTENSGFCGQESTSFDANEFVARSEQELRILRSFNLTYVRDMMDRAVQACVESHPQCAALNPATMLMLLDEIERLEGALETSKTIAQMKLENVAEGSGYKRAFEDGVDFQKTKSLDQGRPCAWGVQNRDTKQVRFLSKKPDSIGINEVAHPLYMYSGMV